MAAVDAFLHEPPAVPVAAVRDGQRDRYPGLGEIRPPQMNVEMLVPSTLRTGDQVMSDQDVPSARQRLPRVDLGQAQLG